MVAEKAFWGPVVRPLTLLRRCYGSRRAYLAHPTESRATRLEEPKGPLIRVAGERKRIWSNTPIDSKQALSGVIMMSFHVSLS
jgi:hypothetical protein